MCFLPFCDFLLNVQQGFSLAGPFFYSVNMLPSFCSRSWASHSLRPSLYSCLITQVSARGILGELAPARQSQSSAQWPHVMQPYLIFSRVGLYKIWTYCLPLSLSSLRTVVVNLLNVCHSELLVSLKALKGLPSLLWNMCQGHAGIIFLIFSCLSHLTFWYRVDVHLCF